MATYGVGLQTEQRGVNPTPTMRKQETVGGKKKVIYDPYQLRLPLAPR